MSGPRSERLCGGCGCADPPAREFIESLHECITSGRGRRCGGSRARFVSRCSSHTRTQGREPHDAHPSHPAAARHHRPRDRAGPGPGRHRRRPPPPPRGPRGRWQDLRGTRRLRPPCAHHGARRRRRPLLGGQAHRLVRPAPRAEVWLQPRELLGGPADGRHAGRRRALHQRAQPHARERPERAPAGSRRGPSAGAPHRRGARRPRLSGDRHPEPRRVRGHRPPLRGPARPLRAPRAGLPDARPRSRPSWPPRAAQPTTQLVPPRCAWCAPRASSPRRARAPRCAAPSPRGHRRGPARPADGAGPTSAPCCARAAEAALTTRVELRDEADAGFGAVLDELFALVVDAGRGRRTSPSWPPQKPERAGRARA